MTNSRTSIILYSVAALLSLAGLAEATYLTVQNLAGETIVCAGSTGCFEVLGSRFAKVGGIPVAAFGAVAYFAAFQFRALHRFRLRPHADAIFPHGVGNVSHDTLATFCASLHPARLLPILFVFRRDYFFPNRNCRCQPSGGVKTVREGFEPSVLTSPWLRNTSLRIRTPAASPCADDSSKNIRNLRPVKSKKR